jgi:hypothetical protein
MGTGKTSYDEVVSPNDYKNINPLGNGAFSNLFNQIGGMAGQLGSSTSTDPSAAIRQFLGLMPELQGVVSSATGDLGRGLREQSQRMIDESTSQVASEFSNLGSLYSGGAIDTATRRAGEIGANAGNQLAMQQLGLLNTFGNTGLQGLLSGQQNNLNLMGNLYGMQSGMAAPAMTAPTMAANYNPSFGEQILPWLNLGVNAFGLAK